MHFSTKFVCLAVILVFVDGARVNSHLEDTPPTSPTLTTSQSAQPSGAGGWIHRMKGWVPKELPKHIWPFHSTTTTTAMPTSSLDEFAKGIASALGFADASSCAKDVEASVDEVAQAAQDILKGSRWEKLKATEKFCKAAEEAMLALKPCESAMSDAELYIKLEKDLRDKRFYTVHNALTMLVHTAEEHQKLHEVATDISTGKYFEAGNELVTVLMSVLEEDAIPDSSKLPIKLQVARGIAKGLSGDVTDNQCFKDTTVGIPDLVAGVMDVASVVKIKEGLISIFHGVADLINIDKACKDAMPSLKNLLKALEDFKDVEKLSEFIVHNVIEGAVDLSLESMSAVLDYKGNQWERFGEDIGQILGKVLL